MDDQKTIKKRRGFIKCIIGEWMSDEIQDKITKKRCKISFRIKEDFPINENLCTYQGHKHFSDGVVEFNFHFYWINKFLCSNNTNFNGCFYVNENKTKLFVHPDIHNKLPNDNNLILTFNKENSIND